MESMIDENETWEDCIRDLERQVEQLAKFETEHQKRREVHWALVLLGLAWTGGFERLPRDALTVGSLAALVCTVPFLASLGLFPPVPPGNSL